MTITTPRFIRNTAILAKVETTPGTDAVPTGSANAMLVSNLSINPMNAQNDNRDLVRPYFGGSDQLVGTRYVEMGFDVELQSSGALGVAPAWGALLRACAAAEAISTGARVEYSPITAGQESVTIYWYDDGLLHVATMCRGTCTLKADIGSRPMLSFKFTGLYATPTAAANPSSTLTAWKVPKVVTNANSAGLLLGCTYATGAFTGGTPYVSRGMELDFANAVQFTPFLGEEDVDITDRDSTGKLQLAVTAAQEAALFASIEANTTQSLGFTHGSADGYKIMIFAPKVQMINPSKADVNGRRLFAADLRFLPSTGNDEFRIIAA